MQLCEPDDLVAGTCPFVSGPSEVWAAAGAVMSGALRGQDRNYWTEGGWQRKLALGANRCCNHKEIHNLWIKYEELGQKEWRLVSTLSLLLGLSQWFAAILSTTGWSDLVVTGTRWIISNDAGFLKRTCEMWPKTLEITFARRQMFVTYCRCIIQKLRVSGHSMLCQSVLKHLRHSSSVMKSVKKRGIWQNVLRTLFYHKCFVS